MPNDTDDVPPPKDQPWWLRALGLAVLGFVFVVSYLVGGLVRIGKRLLGIGGGDDDD